MKVVDQQYWGNRCMIITKLFSRQWVFRFVGEWQSRCKAGEILPVIKECLNTQYS